MAWSILCFHNHGFCHLSLSHSFNCRGSNAQSSSNHVSRPEAMSMDFVVRPQSKVDPDEVRARAKQMLQNQRRVKVSSSLPI